MARNRTGKLALGALVAAGIGYAAGVLTAPKSGRETRKDLQAAAQKAKREAEVKLKNLHSNLSDLISSAKQQMSQMGKSAQSELEQALRQANSAKDKARELLSAVHEGEANNADLQAAIEEVKQATQHLKSFVKDNAKSQK